MFNKRLKKMALLAAVLILLSLTGCGMSYEVRDSSLPVYLINGTPVYYTAIDGDDLFYYNGFWWKPIREGWYRSIHYTGPWEVINVSVVPGVVINLSPGWREHVREGRVYHWKQIRTGNPEIRSDGDAKIIDQNDKDNHQEQKKEDYNKDKEQKNSKHPKKSQKK